MKTFVKTAAQGEITIRRIDALPAGVKPLDPEHGKFIIGHSETGHHHSMTIDRKSAYVSDRAPDGMRILYANLEAAAELVHERGHDTHETISFEPGIYEFRIGREYDPYAELARQQMD